MLTLKEATHLALETIAKVSRRSTDEFAFFDEHAICKPYGWVVFYDSRKYAETGDFLHAFGGNGPIVVMHDGATHLLGSASRPETTIATFEREHGL